MVPLLNTPTTSAMPSRQTDDLNRTHGRQLGAGPDNNGGVLRDLSEQIGGLMQQLFEATVGVIEEGADALRRRRVEPARGGDVVDEEPIALVGRARGLPRCAAAPGTPPARAPPSRCERWPS